MGNFELAKLRNKNDKAILTIRITEELRREFARLAEERGVSVNAEIAHRLQSYIDAQRKAAAIRPLLGELRAIADELRGTKA